MALGLLWLSLAILVVLQTQARDSTPDLIPAPPLLRVPVYPDFRNEQFQGKWYIIGYAGNGFKKEKHSKLKRYTVTYELNNDDSYNVTSIAPRDQRCENWTKISTQNFRLSQFNLHNIEGNTGMSSYTARVVTTDYDQFAILHFRKVYNNQEYIKVNLYGRTKELPTVLRKIFINFAKSLGLTDDNIFFTRPTDECKQR